MNAYFRKIKFVNFYKSFYYGKDKTNECTANGKWLPPPTSPCNTREATGALPAFKVEIDVTYDRTEVPMSYRLWNTVYDDEYDILRLCGAWSYYKIAQ